MCVKDLRSQRFTNFGDQTLAVIRANTLNGCVDRNPAEDAGGISNAHTRRAAVSAAAGAASATPVLRTAGEWSKLKQLYDQKVPTKAE